MKTVQERACAQASQRLGSAHMVSSFYVILNECPLGGAARSPFGSSGRLSKVLYDDLTSHEREHVSSVDSVENCSDLHRSHPFTSYPKTSCTRYLHFWSSAMQSNRGSGRRDALTLLRRGMSKMPQDSIKVSAARPLCTVDEFTV